MCYIFKNYNKIYQLVDNFGGVINVILPDLNPDKVALEQLYEDTDIKREKSATLQLLVRIERLIFETQGNFVDMEVPENVTNVISGNRVYHSSGADGNNVLIFDGNSYPYPDEVNANIDSLIKNWFKMNICL